MQIKCSNAECSQTLKIPDTAAGKPVRCPACGTITVADAPIEAEPGGIDFESLAGLDSGKPVDTPPAVPGAPPDAPTSPSAETVSTPMPNWVRESTRPQSPDLPHTSPGQPGPNESFAGTCFGAIGFAMRNFGTVMSMVALLLGITLGLGLLGFLANLLSGGAFLMGLARFITTPFGGIVYVLVMLALSILVGGYFWSFFEDVVSESQAWQDEKIYPPDFAAGPLFLAGLRSLAFQIVYIWPIITIPLAPLGLLGLGVYRNPRGLDVIWAAKTAFRHPGKLLTLWGVMLVYLPVPIIASIVIVMLLVAATVGSMGGGWFGAIVLFVLWLVGYAVMVTIQMLYSVIGARCAGVMARHAPQSVQDLGRRSPYVPLAYVAVGLVGGIVIQVMALFAVASSVDFTHLERDMIAMQRKRKSDQRSRVDAGQRGDSRERRPRYRRPEPDRREVVRREEDPKPVRPRVASNDPNRIAPSLQRLGALGRALRLYARQHDDKLPRSLTTLAYRDYISRSDLQCYVSPPIHYSYFSGLTLEADPNFVLAYSPRNFQDGRRAVVSLDGSAKAIKESELLSMLSQQRQWLLAQREQSSGDDDDDTVAHRDRRPAVRVYVPSRREIRDSHDLSTRAKYKVHNAMADLRAYARDHEGAYPDSLDVLLKEGYVTAEKQLRSERNEDVRLVYIPGQKASRTGDDVLLYDPVAYAGDKRTIATAAGAVKEIASAGLLNQMLTRQDAPKETLIPENPVDCVAATWDVENASADEVSENNWLWAHCRVLKEIKHRRQDAIVGVGFGPKADDTDSDGYKAFRKEVAKRFAALLKRLEIEAHREQTYTTDGVDYDRLLASPGGMKQLTVLTTVQDGRCVAYWFAGEMRCFKFFREALGEAEAVE
jgi:hypothetical protein